MNKEKLMKLTSKILLMAIITISIFTPTLASEKVNSKEEVVYGMLFEDGSVDEVYIVNIFDEIGSISDYGNYSNVRNMTSSEKIDYKDDTVTFYNSEDKLYYEGELKAANLPWDIEIKYFIDNKEYSPHQLAGMSGDVEIQIKTKANNYVDKFFYENYALQINLLFDTSKFKDIVAKEATIVNIGNSKQLTYTVLPNKEADITVKATVKEFEMEAIAINGINLNLGLDIDDKQLNDKLSEIIDIIHQFDQGASELNKGAFKLKDGSSQLADGAKNIELGSSDLNSGVGLLINGLKEIEAGLKDLDKQSINLTQGSLQFKNIIKDVAAIVSTLSVDIAEIENLSQASSDIKTGIYNLNLAIKQLNENVSYTNYKNIAKSQGLDIDQLVKGNNQALALLAPMIEEIDEISSQLEKSEIPELQDVSQQLAQQNENLNKVKTLFVGNNAAIASTETYLNEVSKVISQVYGGSSELDKSYKHFDSAVNDLVLQLVKVVSQLPELNSNIDKVVEKYDEFDTGLNNYTEAVNQLLKGQEEIIAGAQKLNTGSLALKKGSFQLYNNMNDLVDGSTSLYENTTLIKDKTHAINNYSSGLDVNLQAEIDAKILEITGDASKSISFASDKNGQIKAVQFVLKSKDINIKEDTTNESIKKVEEDLTLWQKIKELFKFTKDENL